MMTKLVCETCKTTLGNIAANYVGLAPSASRCVACTYPAVASLRTVA